MRITFDAAKRDATLKDRKVDFADAFRVFAGRTILFADNRVDYGEARYQTIGYLFGRMVMVVWPPRGDARHVISMRKCNGREQKKYRKRFEEA
jgi:uncharacterized DUF497 family protein